MSIYAIPPYRVCLLLDQYWRTRNWRAWSSPPRGRYGRHSRSWNQQQRVPWRQQGRSWGRPLCRSTTQCWPPRHRSWICWSPSAAPSSLLCPRQGNMAPMWHHASRVRKTQPGTSSKRRVRRIQCNDTTNPSRFQKFRIYSNKRCSRTQSSEIIKITDRNVCPCPCYEGVWQAGIYS